MGRIGTFQRTVKESAREVNMGHVTDEWQNEDDVVVGVHCMDGLSGAPKSYELHVEFEEQEFGGDDEEHFQGASNKVTRMRGEAADVMRDIASGDFPPEQEDEKTVAATATTGSESKVNPTIKGGTHSHWERKVKEYLKEWYPEAENSTVEIYGTTYAFEVDWSDVEVIVSGRMKRSSGRARAFTDKLTGERNYELKISKHLIENQDWDRVEQTIRHEAIHIWQYQNDSFSGGHGLDFKKWMRHEQFDCTVNAERPAADPKYEIICENCGEVGVRQRACKITKKTHLYHCSTCGGNLEVNQLR